MGLEGCKNLLRLRRFVQALDRVANVDFVGLEPACIHFQCEARRSGRLVRHLGQSLHLMNGKYGAAFIQVRNGKWDEGVSHPHRVIANFRKDEQHAFQTAHFFSEHQADLARGLGICNVGAHVLAADLEHDCTQSGLWFALRLRDRVGKYADRCDQHGGGKQKCRQMKKTAEHGVYVGRQSG